MRQRKLVTTARSGVEVVRNGKHLIDFSSNDYLGLGHHPALQKAATAALELGAGSGGSRLVTGNHPLYEKVEAKLTKMRGKPCLLFNSGFHANVSVLSALAPRDGLLLLDRACHHSLVQGARLTGAKIRRYRSVGQLEAWLQPGAWVVTEALFSVDGRKPDLHKIASLTRAAGAKLYVDEAHAFGVLPLFPDCDVAVGTFGKGAGGFGAYVATEERELLINRCGGLIYSTALPPMVVGVIDAALDLLPSCDREGLLRKAEWLREELPFDTGPSAAQIIPLTVGSDERALALQAHLEERGILAVALRPPTTPEGEACVRLSLSTAHTQAHLNQLVEAVRAWR